MRSALLILVATVGLAAVDTAQAWADQPAPAAASDAAARQPEVTISAQRAALAQRINTFVNLVTDFDIGDPTRGLARWQIPVCPLVAGFPQKWAEYVLARITEVGQAAGVPLAPEHCRHPNLYVLVSKQPEALLRDLQTRHGVVVFGGAAPEVVNGFIAASRPVKTWYDTAQRTAEGLPMVNQSFPGISQQVADKGLGAIKMLPVAPNLPPGASTNSWSQASRLTFNVVAAIYQVFVIVDPTQFKGVSLGQLADYVAMAGLAQLRLDTRLGDVPTILTLFDMPAQSASAGMTDWDQALLKSIYETEQKSVVQRSSIAHGMVDQIVH